jgi:hypothetical protein
MAGARGESILRSGENEYRILFTNRALAEAESAIGKSIIAIAQGFQFGTTGFAEVSKLLAAGLEAARRDARTGGRTLTLLDAYNVMDEVGFTECSRAVMEAVAAVLRYGSEDAEHPAAGESPNP